MSRLSKVRPAGSMPRLAHGKREEAQLFVLAGIGRSGVCLLHALLVASSKFQASQSMLTHGDSCCDILLHPSQAVRKHCTEMLSASNNLFHHYPNEGDGENFKNHSDCSCGASPQRPALIHIHSLFTNPIMFGEFLSCVSELTVKPKLIVSKADWERTVKSRFFKSGRRDGISGFLGDHAAILADAYLMARAYDRLKAAQRAGLEMELVDVAELNQNAPRVAKQISDFVGARLNFTIPILVRGIEWTGGRTPPFGNEHANKSYPSLSTIHRLLLVRVDPTKGESKFFGATAIALMLITIIACLRAPYLIIFSILRVIISRGFPRIADLESTFPEITVASQIVREIQAFTRRFGKS